jgi:hypothetical protein
MQQNIDALVAGINRELTPVFEERLRAALADADRDWLVDQVVRLTLDAHSLAEIDRRSERDAKTAARAARLERVKRLALDESVLRAFITECDGLTRESLQGTGHLSADAPAKGTTRLAGADRGPAGEELLERAKDTLYALLFGDEESATSLDRVTQELLTFALPRGKAGALDFMRASTELAAAGTWQDPDSVSNDERADNVVLEVQFGEVAGELVGHGIISALRLINNLEVNEQVLYARMVNVEETTLIN